MAGFPRLENRENEKCQGKVREFDFGQNVREMSGNLFLKWRVGDKMM